MPGRSSTLSSPACSPPDWRGSIGAVEDLVNDGLELLIVVAIGGMLWAAVGRLRRRQVTVPRCPACDRPVSHAYPRCPDCGEPTPTLEP